MRVRDFYDRGETAWLVLREKGGRERRLPAHHIVRNYIRSYVDAAGLAGREQAGAPLFQSTPGASDELSGRPLDRSSVLSMVKRRCRGYDAFLRKPFSLEELLDTVESLLGRGAGRRRSTAPKGKRTASPQK